MEIDKAFAIALGLVSFFGGAFLRSLLDKSKEHDHDLTELRVIVAKLDSEVKQLWRLREDVQAAWAKLRERKQ